MIANSDHMQHQTDNILIHQNNKWILGISYNKKIHSEKLQLQRQKVKFAIAKNQFMNHSLNEPSQMCAQELENDVSFEKQKVWGKEVTRHYRMK